MVKVFIVEEHVDYEGSSVMGVFSAKKPADALAVILRSEEKRHEYSVTEYELQSATLPREFWLNLDDDEVLIAEEDFNPVSKTNPTGTWIKVREVLEDKSGETQDGI